MRFGVVVFPGTNCEQETVRVLRDLYHQPTELLWHASEDLSGIDCVVLPGGFAHGDYLRAGAIARFSPIMRAVERFARAGGLVWGICNGFQILLEAGLLPGAMRRNVGLRFRCQWVHVRVEHTRSPFTAACRPGQVLHLPIAHGEGNYYAPPELLARLEARGQILLRYCDAAGHVTPAANPNGSVANVAGLASEGGNVFALMPHPERAAEALLGGTDGRWLFDSVLGKVGLVATV
ncbi:MAG TPA: phosphoribosylformylglycinamidine synthase subunit PurQ [Chloroflexota bacterium]|nr:phosphoribosylformylglycinamidine synthase subunit PurQ [Chloroflexota bacterium]